MAQKFGMHCHACKIDQNTYFFHGGTKDDRARSKAYLIDIKEREYERLTDRPGKSYGGGSALKNNKVYIMVISAVENHHLPFPPMISLRVSGFLLYTILNDNQRT